MLELPADPDPDDGGAASRAVARLKAMTQPRQRQAVRRLRSRAGTMAIVFAALLGLCALGAMSARFALLLTMLLSVAVAWRPWGSKDDEPDSDVAAAAVTTTASGSAMAGLPTVEGWRLVVDALPEPAVALDRFGNVLHANHSMRELFPKVRDGMPFSHVTRNPDLMNALDSARTVGEPIEVQLVERVPVDRRIAVTVSRLTAPGTASALPTLLVTFRDLSEQDRLDQMRADFVANASHELRTPLASLRGFVETLQGPAREDAAARERFLGLMASQAVRMSRLIDDLLSLSRVEMRAHLAPRGIVDLNEVAAYVRQTLEPLAKSDGVEIEVHALAGPARIRGDRDEIVQVVQNLTQNAVKYGRSGGRVDVLIERGQARSGTPACLTVAVVDDGPGIAPEHLPRLTERFYRVNAAASREKGGTGLGLAIVKHIVVRHRGEFRITSQLGAGSRFAVEFEELRSESA